jgi:predicted RNA-binding protein YlqC (UPF0109 family)
MGIGISMVVHTERGKGGKVRGREGRVIRAVEKGTYTQSKVGGVDSIS